MMVSLSENCFKYLFRIVCFTLLWCVPLTAKTVTIKVKYAEHLTGPWTNWDRVLYEQDKAFLEKYPDYRLEIVGDLRMHGQFSQDAYLLGRVTGTTPDVVQIPVRNASAFINRGMVLPLDRFMAEGGARYFMEHDVRENLIPVVKQNGHIWFLPKNGHPEVLFYRKDRFAAAGLTHPPRNWDELLEYSRKLTDPDRGYYGMGFYGTPGSPSWRWITFLRQAGGDVFTRDTDGKWRCGVADTAGQQALRFYHRLLREPWERNGKMISGAGRIVDYFLVDNFNDGFCAMRITGIYDDRFDPETMGMAPLPAGPTGRHSHLAQDYLAGISSQVTDPDHQQAVWDYITFLQSEVADSIRFQVGLGHGRTDRSSQESMHRYGFEKLVTSPRSDAFIRLKSSVAPYGEPEPWQAVGNIIYNEIDEALMQVDRLDVVDYKAALRSVEKHVNEALLGQIPPEEMARRRIIVRIIIGILILILAVLFVKGAFLAVLRGLRSRRVTGSILHPRHVHLWVAGLLFPAVASVLVWQYFPLVSGLATAFLEFRFIGGTTFVGLDNFITVFWEPIFWQALLNTVIYVIMAVVIGFLIPVILALMLNEIPRGALIYRTIYFIPSIIGSLVVTLLWVSFYSPQDEGLFNQFMTAMGLSPQQWLDDPAMAMICVIIPGVWALSGAGSILYQAALKQVPEALYEQADIDGGGILAKLRHVTLPTLRPIFIIQLTGTVIGAFHATQRIIVMTGGGPHYATHTLGVDIFYNAFVNLRYGYAAAVAWVAGSMVVGFTVLQLRLLHTSRPGTVGTAPERNG